MKKMIFYKEKIKEKCNLYLNIIKTFLFQNKFKIIIVCSLLILFLGVTFIFLSKDKFKSEKIIYENLANEKIEQEPAEEMIPEKLAQVEYYFVDIKGSVNVPGVYSLEKGKRVVDAINKAGGLKNDANTSLLNLSREITDEMVIVVYSNSELDDYKNLKDTKKEVENICQEEITNDACICNNKVDDLIVGDTSLKEENQEKEESKKDEEHQEDEKYELDDEKDQEINKKINLNKASLEELITLPKIGESKAKAIIEYRNNIGLFKSIDEIKNVSGIGDSLFESLKDYITI